MNLVVVGDSLLDIDLQGSVSRLCPDAPAPILDQQERRVRPGGAGLAARLAAAAGTDVTLVTALAADAEAGLLRDLIEPVRVVAGPLGAPTPVKTRLRAGAHTLARVDRCPPGRPGVTDEMLGAVEAADAVLVSDYGRGLVRDLRLRRVLSELVDRVPVVWDPHPKGSIPVPEVTVATPNQAEARQLSGGPPGTGLAAASVAADVLRSRWQARAVAVTLGPHGALLHDGRSCRGVRAPAVTVPDPCGAGDRFAVTVAARLMHGDDLGGAVERAVLESAWFLAGGGVAGAGRPVGREPLAPPADGGPLVPPADGGPLIPPADGGPWTPPADGGPWTPPAGDPLAAATARVRSVQAAGGVVVATGGCFDLLHAGHTRTLRAARDLGDRLIVCLNSDDSVARLKGPDRPVNGQADRAEVLRALGCVDDVVVFDEDGPQRVLGQLRPDIWVKGGDYTADSLPEAGLVRSWGGEVVV
ncbi:MAG TPA: PfkB family carbohydrate kinase, partial [Pseudonocardiaceae bacterium]|nr:PfkB family carbohydrate kinase [Pseudonocardiaceae bacterium]